jgi:methylated-DNA-[protein]-cysteine S-methyltransferase
MTYYTHVLPSPVGEIFIAVNERGAVARLHFLTDESAEEAASGLRGPVVRDARRCRHVAEQLDEYFARARRDFDLDVELDGTPFQKSVWRRLRRIPYGRTLSYRELARSLGNPAATRAVGRANATNPISLVVPCHRVIGADGSLTGFGGGIEIKRSLLELEGSLPGNLFAGRSRATGR